MKSQAQQPDSILPSLRHRKPWQVAAHAMVVNDKEAAEVAKSARLNEKIAVATQRAAEQRRRAKAKAVQVKYGFDWETYSRMLAEAVARGCPICGGSIEKHGSAVDHDHACCAGKVTCGKCVREIICARCNIGLGGFRDDPEAMRRAADYVERHAVRRKQSSI